MAEKLSFYRVPLTGGMFENVIIEDYNDISAHESAMALPAAIGEPEEDGPFYEEVKKPFTEPWPIFTQAYFEALYAGDKE